MYVLECVCVYVSISVCECVCTCVLLCWRVGVCFFQRAWFLPQRIGPNYSLCVVMYFNMMHNPIFLYTVDFILFCFYLRRLNRPQFLILFSILNC
jgi:hypothetical protein